MRERYSCGQHGCGSGEVGDHAGDVGAGDCEGEEGEGGARGGEGGAKVGDWVWGALIIPPRQSLAHALAVIFGFAVAEGSGHEYSRKNLPHNMPVHIG